MRFWLIWFLLCLSVWAQSSPEQLRLYQQQIEARGGRVQAQQLWVLGLRGQAREGQDPATYGDTLVVLRGEPPLLREFAGSTGVEPTGIHAGRPAQLAVAPEFSQEFLQLLGDEPFQYCLLDTRLAQPAAVDLPSIAPVDYSLVQKFNHYQRLILAQGGRLEKGGLAVLGLRGVGLNGQRHPASDNQGGYDDTYVLLARDGQGNPLVSEFPGSTHAGNSQDEDAPPEGVAQVRPGQYRAVPHGWHHSMPCWSVTTLAGSGLIPCWRDADRDGVVCEEEKGGSFRATHILFHNGLYTHRASSIGCLTLPPAVYPRFAQAIGQRRSFNFYLIDCERPLTTRTVEYVLGKSVNGRPVKMYVIGNGPRIALYFATIHGDESAGTDMLLRLKTHLEKNPMALGDWQVRIVPMVNPDSCRRTNARGVDLNRNFPHLWSRSPRDDEYSGPHALSEPEARCVQMAVLGQSPGPAGRPSRIVSIHQHKGIASGEGLLDGDGPAEVSAILSDLLQAAEGRLAARKIPDSRGRLKIPGSFGSWVSSPALNIPTVTFELSHADREGEHNWRNYGPVLLKFLAAP